MYSRALTALALCTALAVETVTAISKISAVGSKFFTADGNQFYIKGERAHHRSVIPRLTLFFSQALHINLPLWIPSSIQINANWTLP